MNTVLIIIMSILCVVVGWIGHGEGYRLGRKAGLREGYEKGRRG